MADSDNEELSEAERARLRRRDRDAQGEDRELMNDGSAKWFKQVLDRRAKVARDEQVARRRKKA